MIHDFIATEKHLASPLRALLQLVFITAVLAGGFPGAFPFAAQ
jgi:hypothetical protein